MVAWPPSRVPPAPPSRISPLSSLPEKLPMVVRAPVDCVVCGLVWGGASKLRSDDVDDDAMRRMRGGDEQSHKRHPPHRDDQYKHGLVDVGVPVTGVAWLTKGADMQPQAFSTHRHANH